jgi:hypothetical protein
MRYAVSLAARTFRVQELVSISDQVLSEYEQIKLGKVAVAGGQSLQVVKAELEARIGGPGQPGRMPPVPGAPGGVKLEEEEGEVKD